jgi:5-methyltetrahydropteroyltriglutamate--homocysteine methyltransferase
LERAVAEVVREQVGLGIDVPTDGGVRRPEPVADLICRLGGIDLDRVTEVPRGRRTELRPTVTGPIKAAREPFLATHWRLAQAAAKRPVKVPIPGPTTVATVLADAHYGGDARALGAALADAINAELRTLAASGCRHVQLDEPAFLDDPPAAAAYGAELVERCFHKLPEGTVRVLNLARPLPAAPDETGSLEPPSDPFPEVLGVLEEARFDQVAFDLVESDAALARLELFARKRVAFGLIDVADETIEEPDAVLARLRAVLGHIDRDRLTAAAGSLARLRRETAQAKLVALVEAARAV